jgi:hypothetical protein
MKEHYEKIVELYEKGTSSSEIASILGKKHSNSVRQILKKLGKLRSQSEASVLSYKQGKTKGLDALIYSAKNGNRFNPKKTPWRTDPTRHPRWIEDRSKLKPQRIRTEEKHFFKEVITERGFKCEITSENGKLSVHHIKGVWKYPELKFDKNNCIVVLERIHKKFHIIYGNRTDQQDWEEFLNNKEYDIENVKRKRSFVPFEDKAGKRYGRLLVISKNGGKWKCICDCGNEHEVSSTNLNNGSTSSCGCKLSETSRDRMSRYNTGFNPKNKKKLHYATV